MNDYFDLLKSAQPGWQSDGLGLQGHPIVFRGNPDNTVEPSFIPSTVERPTVTPTLSSEPMEFPANPGKTYPWIGDLVDDDEQYFAWFGNTTYVSAAGAAPLKGFKAAIFDANDSNASQGFISVGDPDSTKDGLVFQYGGAIWKARWIDDSNVGNPETYVQNAAEAYTSWKADEWIMSDSVSAPQHAFGIHPGYMDIDNSKVFLGWDDDAGEYKEVIYDGTTHAIGIHASYLEYDSSKVFLGLDDTDAQWKLALNDGTLGSGFMTGYLELASQKVFLGYSSTEETTHLTIVPDTAYVELGTSSQGFFGYGSDSTWHMAINDDTAYVELGTSSNIFLGYGSDSIWELTINGDTSNSLLSADDLTFDADSGDSTDLSAGELDLTDSDGTMTITGSTASTDASTGGFYVGDASLVTDSCTVGSGGGFYVDSASLTNSACTVDGFGGFYVGGSSYLDGSINLNGTTFSPVNASWCDDSGNPQSGQILAAVN